MTTKIYQKLIRDKIPQFFAAPNKTFNVRVLDNQEFKVSLRNKLVEESQEVLSASTRDDLINEIADLCEVLNYIKLSENISDSDVDSYRLHKKEERGAFDQKLFLESISEQ